MQICYQVLRETQFCGRHGAEWEERGLLGSVSPRWESWCPYLITMLLWPNYLTFLPQHSHLQNKVTPTSQGCVEASVLDVGKQVEGGCLVSPGCRCSSADSPCASSGLGFCLCVCSLFRFLYLVFSPQNNLMTLSLRRGTLRNMYTSNLTFLLV